MLYSRYARREEESIRRAFRILGIQSPGHARRLLKKAGTGSRLAQYMAASDETATTSGLADALLHPRVTTYRIDALLEMVTQAGLEPLLFAHRGAREDPAEEIARLRMLEKDRQSPGNFVLYLGRRNGKQVDGGKSDSQIMLNPCLTGSMSRFAVGTLQVNSRIGVANPPLSYGDKSFLRKFITPVRSCSLTSDEVKRVAVYKRLLFLIEFQP